MNTLAKNDLHAAYALARTAENIQREAPQTIPGLPTLCDAVQKLCHVCQALSEDLDSKANPGDRLAELQLRVYKLEKALKSHTNTQDAHNF